MKSSMSVTIKNATLDVANDTIMEERKEEVITSSLSKLLKSWDGIDGISITIKKDSADVSNETTEGIETLEDSVE